MSNAENTGLTTTKAETTFEEMLNAIEDSLSDLAGSHDGEDGEDEDNDEVNPELGKLSGDDEPSWVMGTSSKTVQHGTERFRQKLMMLSELSEPGWGDAADYFHERDIKYGVTKLNFPQCVQSQRKEDSTCSAPTTIDEPMETCNIVPGRPQMPQLTSRPGSSQMSLELRKCQTYKRIPSLPPTPAPHSSMLHISKLVEPVSYNPCSQRP